MVSPDKLEATRGSLLGEVVRAEGFEESVELRAVVGVLEVSELVENDVVTTLVREAHKVQVDVALARAASPVFF